jgi:hypothetical protein
MPLYRFAQVEAALMDPVTIKGESHPVSRFARSYLVRSGSMTDAVETIRKDLWSEGAQLIATGPYEFATFRTTGIGILRHLMPGSTDGVRWRSGRAFYRLGS